MSFSGEVKEELLQNYSKARHCRLAELSAILHMGGEFSSDRNEKCVLRFRTENFPVARKCFTLMEKTFNIRTDVVIRHNSEKGNWNYILSWKGEELMAVKHPVVQAVCCKRAYIRGAFLVSGSVSDPKKSYHFEIVCGQEEQARYLQSLINSFDVDAKIVVRKHNYVVYLKEGSQIVDILNVMEAPIALMDMENVRIEKETRNSINRKVNCETANIKKVVSASVRQKEDIIYIRDTIGFDKLPEGLRDIALARLNYPDAPLKELGETLDPPLGKSGVNHRLRKLSEIADRMRNNKEA
ncbi:MAG: DNA-binding protein WhiA [Lachnospiraceae bacterium]